MPPCMQDDGTTKITFGDQGPAPPAKTPEGPKSWPRLLGWPLPAAHEVITTDGFDAQDVVVVRPFPSLAV